MEWQGRYKAEKSIAIKCPTLGLHLAGCKKVQQELANPNELEHFISDTTSLDLLRSVFASLYSLDAEEWTDEEIKKKQRKNVDDNYTDDEKSMNSYQQLINHAIAHPELYVMKPQREGGGNNIYGSDIATSLQSFSSDELKSYILMERIFPPPHVSSLLREGNNTEVCIHFSQKVF